MPEPVRFYFDPACPWCYQTSRWAKRLDELGEVDLDFGIFSLEVVNLADDKDPRELEARSGPALRTAILIRDSEGRKALGPFYGAVGRRTFEEPPPPEDRVQMVRDALDEVGLDTGLVDKAMADPATWDAVLEEHRALVERTRSFGVPTIVLDGGEGPAMFGPVVSELPGDEEAVELWRHVSWLVRYDNFSELKRNRVKPPDLATIRWRREQRRQQAGQG